MTEDKKPNRADLPKEIPHRWTLRKLYWSIKTCWSIRSWWKEKFRPTDTYIAVPRDKAEAYLSESRENAKHGWVRVEFPIGHKDDKYILFKQIK